MLKQVFIVLVILIATFAIVPDAKAQCSMCTINAEQATKNGNTQGKGLNSGIVYLLAIPYILIGGIGVLWYRNYRKKANSAALEH